MALEQIKLYDLRLQVKGNLIYINDIVVISQSSRLQLRIFHILFEQFLHDLKSGLPTDQYTFLSLEQLAKHLNIDLMTADNLERKARRPLNRMRQTIKDKLVKELGFEINNNDIIECRGWPGYSCKNHGYRINPCLWKIRATISSIYDTTSMLATSR